MKSERAKLLISRNDEQVRFSSANFNKITLTAAVELAEADARERAIKALCHQSCYGTCPLVVPYSGCGKMNAFLGFYDKTE